MIYQNSLSSLLSKLIEQGVPGGPVIKNPPCNAGKTGFIPGPRRSHMLRSSYARGTITEPTSPGARALQQENTTHGNSE